MRTENTVIRTLASQLSLEQQVHSGFYLKYVSIKLTVRFTNSIHCAIKILKLKPLSSENES